MRHAVAAVLLALALAPGARAEEGMWMLHQLGDLDQQAMRQMGLNLTPRELWDPATNTGLAAAVPSLGGCSSSFVSPEGLIATNHHCAFGAIQMNSTPEHDYITTGFLARTRADELPGRTQRVYVFKGYDDVTAKVVEVLKPGLSPEQRVKAIERREKELAAECEKLGLRCQVAEMFGGREYYLYKQLEIRDVRLVYAPPRSIGEYGGEIDNWMWPRHTGDFSFFRAYVGPDGKPADFSPDNVPFRPDRTLKVSTEGVADGDFTMIIGYPGRTMRFRIAALVAEDTAFAYPQQIKLLKEWIAILEARGRTSKEVEIKVASQIKGLANGLKKSEGMLEGLRRFDLAAKKKAEEVKLQAWIDADPGRKAKWGAALPSLAQLAAEKSATRDRDFLMGYLPRASSLLSSGLTITRWAQEKVKPELERDFGYQARDERSIRMRQATMQKNLDVATERAALTYFLGRAAALPPGQRIATVDAALAATGKTGDEAIAALLDSILGKTILTDDKVRLSLLAVDEAGLAAKNDPMLAFAAALRREIKGNEDRARRVEGETILHTPRYIEALAAFRGKALYPDANSTIRFTYATVKGYSPRDAVSYRPFTTLRGVVEKCTGEDPFNCPQTLLEAAKKASATRWFDARLGDVPACFLSTNDITGGNSGSPIMNGKGELVGLAFDGDYESMTSDFLFDPPLTRTINVDARYMLWVMEHVDKAHNLLREMGIEPQGT